jgi:hypothetical protein
MLERGTGRQTFFQLLHVEADKETVRPLARCDDLPHLYFL